MEGNCRDLIEVLHRHFPEFTEEHQETVHTTGVPAEIQPKHFQNKLRSIIT